MTIAELAVKIGADVTELEKGTNQAESSINKMSTSMSEMAKSMGKDVQGFSSTWKLMSDEMKTAYQTSQATLLPFKKDLMDVEYQHFKLAQSMKTYTGTTGEFMSSLEELGKKHKSVTDTMLKNNDMAKQSFIQSISTMMARSTQSEKIAQNFDRMNNPLYKVNNSLLKVTQGIEGIAKAGQPARLALEMLGPTANMKELQDMTRLINQGLMRFTAVALAAGIASAVLYGGLHKMAMELNPTYLATYTTMIEKLKLAFQPMAEAFAAVMIPVYQFITGIANLIIKFNEAHPTLAKFIQAFFMLLPILTLILSPLAIGIGLFGGFKAAIAAVWMILSPLVTGFATVIGTIAILSAALVGIVAVLYLLWTKTDWFKDAVLTVWDGIKSGTQAVWNFINDKILTPIINEIVSFGKDMLDKFKGFWDKNGSDIKSIVKSFTDNVWSKIEKTMNLIRDIFEVVFPIVSDVVEVAWNFIELHIKNVTDTILGVIQVFLQIFQGDWDGAFETIKETATNIMNNIKDTFQNLDLNTIGKDIIQGLIDGIGSMASAVWDKVKSIADSIKDTFTDALDINSPSRVFKGYGININEGLVEGIKSSSSMIDKIMGNTYDGLGFTANKMMNNSGSSSGDTRYGDIYVSISAKDVQEFNGVIDFFNRLPQVAKQF